MSQASAGRPRALLCAVLVVPVLLAGCVDGTATGGGWIPSDADSTQKATFGFTARCVEKKNGDLVPKVQFQFVDQAAGVAIHGTVTDFGEQHDPCDAGQDAPTEVDMTGTYRSQPKKSPGGVFELEVTDGGEPGPSNGDELCLTLFPTSGPNYENCGPTAGGNIQVFPA